MTRPDSSPERLAFDSDAFPPAERMERYRALYGIGADIVQTGPAPRVTFEGWRLDRALLYQRRLNDIGHGRSEQRVEQDGFSHWTATLVFDGWFGVDLGGGLKRLAPGEIQLVDVNRPVRNQARHAWIATLSISRDKIEELTGSLAGLHGLILDAKDSRLYADFVRSLLSNLPTMKNRSLAAATSAMCTLLKVALEAHGRREPLAAMSREGARLTRLRVLVDARLDDPQFDAAAAITESGLSRATLYRLLPSRQGLAAFILARRLEQVRRDLSVPHDKRPFAEIAAAAGFTAESHASRAFLTRFGLRPGEYRTAVTQAADVNPTDQFRLWQSELR